MKLNSKLNKLLNLIYLFEFYVACNFEILKWNCDLLQIVMATKILVAIQSMKLQSHCDHLG